MAMSCMPTFELFSLGEQVDQILLIFQSLHELLLRNASIWILLKLVEKTLKIWGMIKESKKREIDVLQGDFFTGPPPKKFKCEKPGEVRLGQVYLGRPRYT